MQETASQDTLKRVLVTGGGGFLGRAIVERLVKKGDQVRSLSRSFYQGLDQLGVEQIQGDLADKASVEQACKDVQIVFHTAAKPGIWGDYSEYFKTNVMGTRNILAACFYHKIDRLIYTSSPSVIFNGKDMEGVDESVSYPKKFHSHYPKTKAIAEQYVVQASKRGLKTIILRPHLIWGPRDRHLVPRILAKSKRLIRIGTRENLVDTIYIDNAVDAHLLAADSLEKNPQFSGKIYFISQDDPIPVWDMINAILKAGEQNPVNRCISQKLAWYLGAAIEKIYKIFQIKAEPPLTRFVVAELSTAHWFDISAAKRDLGYQPQISTQEGLQRLTEWLKNHK